MCDCVYDDFIFHQNGSLTPVPNTRFDLIVARHHSQGSLCSRKLTVESPKPLSVAIAKGAQGLSSASILQEAKEKYIRFREDGG